MPSSSLAQSGEILFATDFCELSRRALLYVKKLALQSGAAVRSVHVIDLTRTAKADRSFSSVQDSAERMLREMRRELRVGGLRESATLIAAGKPAEAIRKMAAQYGSGMIVIGVNSRGRPQPGPLGNTARILLETAPCPVLTVGARCRDAPPAGPFRRSIFVGDKEPASLRAGREAWALSGDFGTAPKYAVLTAEERELADGLRRAFQPIRIVEYGAAAEEILAEAAKVEVLVVARQAHGSLDSFARQGAAHALATGAPCPVLWVRHDGAQA